MAPPDETTLRLSVDAYYWQDGRWSHQKKEWYKRFEIQVSKCLIATATYGSELGPELMFLRRFRDNVILTTFTGRQFMRVFNMIYYTFSPAIASTIAGSRTIRTMARIALYPLMATLHLGPAVYRLLAFNPELAVIIFCLTVTSLLAIMYSSVGLAPKQVSETFRFKKGLQNHVYNMGGLRGNLTVGVSP